MLVVRRARLRRWLATRRQFIVDSSARRVAPAQAAVALASRSGDARELSRCLTALCLIFNRYGRWHEAVEIGQRSVDLATGRDRAVAQTHLAMSLRLGGRTAQAVETASVAVAALRPSRPVDRGLRAVVRSL